MCALTQHELKNDTHLLNLVLFRNNCSLTIDEMAMEITQFGNI